MPRPILRAAIFDRFEYLLALTFLGQQDGPEHGLAGCSTCAQ